MEEKDRVQGDMPDVKKDEEQGERLDAKKEDICESSSGNEPQANAHFTDMFGFVSEKQNVSQNEKYENTDNTQAYPTMNGESDPRRGKYENYEKTNKKDIPRRILVVSLGVVLALFTFFFGYMTSSLTQSKDIRAFNWALEMIEKHYIGDTVDGVGPYTREDYLKSGLGLLDKYSGLLTPTEVQRMLQSAEGKSDDIGVYYEISMHEEKAYVKVTGTIKGSNSYSKLYEGDLIESINDVAVEANKETGFAKFALKGFGNEKFTILRPYYREDQIVYEKIDVLVAAAAPYKTSFVTYIDDEMQNAPNGLDSTTAYIKFAAFNEPAADEIKAAIDEMARENRKNLILDLRSNPGGYLDLCAEISGYFVGNGTNKPLQLFSDVYKNNYKIVHYTNHAVYDSMDFDKVVVLVNENTASASEVMLGAMIDYNTADLIIGKTTYGKGIGQTTYFDRPTGYGVTVTSLKWFTPLGVSIHKKGFAPSEGYELEKNEKNYPYTYDDDSHIRKALEYINA